MAPHVAWRRRRNPGLLAGGLSSIAPNRVLAQKTPLEVIDTDSGFHSVVGVLGRIEHGVYS